MFHFLSLLFSLMFERRNRGDPAKEKTYRAQAVMIQNSNSSVSTNFLARLCTSHLFPFTLRAQQPVVMPIGCNNVTPPFFFFQTNKESFGWAQARHNTSAPPRGRGPPRTSQQVKRQVPQTRQRPPAQVMPQSQQQRPAAPKPQVRQVKYYQLQENERFGKNLLFFVVCKFSFS